MNSPLPNKEVRGSSSGIAIMALFDLLGRKWNMKIMWELRTSALSFRAIQKQCDDMSPSVLNSRLKQLSTAKLLLSTDDGYRLTPSGKSLMATLDPLRIWAKEWQQEFNDETQ
ncbi:MAG: helix-turn-helix transcriptional regulator [Colwellia sp.]|nr:helix-turn-helix transcriptional regulator [Colwellia sp.]